MTDYTLTAADYVYLDRADTLYGDTKAFIASHRDHTNSDAHVKGRPGIPGTLKVLNERIMTLVELGQFDTAARLIGRKVAKAYRVTP